MMTEPIHVQIRFDASSFNATFLTQEQAAQWIVEMLGALLREYPLLHSSLIQVQRS